MERLFFCDSGFFTSTVGFVQPTFGVRGSWNEKPKRVALYFFRLAAFHFAQRAR